MICTGSLNILSDEIFSYFKSSRKKKVQVNKNLSSSNRGKENAGSGPYEKILTLDFPRISFKILRIMEAPAHMHLCCRNTFLMTCYQPS